MKKNDLSTFLVVFALFLLACAVVQMIILPHSRFWVASISNLILSNIGASVALEGDTFHLGNLQARVSDSCLQAELVAIAALVTTVAFVIAHIITHQEFPTMKMTSAMFITIFLSGIFYNILRITAVLFAYFSLSPPPTNPVEAWTTLHDTISTMMWLSYGTAWTLAGRKW